MHAIKYVFISFLFFVLDLHSSFSQDLGEIGTKTPDSLGIQVDSLVQSDLDLIAQDSSAIDSLKSRIPNKNDLETTVAYKCKDSITFDVGSHNIYMFGESEVNYGTISLKAAETKVNWITKIVDATHYLDSANRKRGKPVFVQDGQAYEANDMSYNFKSRKAVIHGVATKMDEAYIQGENVKKSPDNEFYIREAKYTTCNLEHPHFHIHSKKLKVIPGKKVISGLFNMKFREIDTPLGFFFGMFPQPNKDANGLIVPSYGEERRRGFFLRDGGYYFKINDYIDLRLTGDVYTTGSFGYRINSKYKKRYKYNGNLSYRFNRNKSLELDNPLDSRDFSLSWTHTPQSTGTSRFSSSVNIQTRSFFENSNEAIYDPTRNTTAQFTSSVRYSKTFRGTPFSLTTNLRHNQNLSTGVVSMSLPDLNLNTARQYPFKNIGFLKNTLFEKLSFSHTMTMNNRVSNNAVDALNLGGKEQLNRNPVLDSIIPFQQENFNLILQRSQLGIRHSIPISTSFNILKFITASPNFNYTEVWAPKLGYEYDEEKDGFIVDTVSQFSTARWYSMGASFTTRLYGFMYFKKGKIKAIRHVMNPSVSISYSPSFENLFHRQENVRERDGDLLLDPFQGMGVPAAPLGERASINFSLGNNLEMKVKADGDSTQEFKKIKLFENLAISSSYNLLADSFNLSDIRLSVGTSLFNRKLTISTSGTIDPYVYQLIDKTERENGGFQVTQRRIDDYKWNRGQGLGQISSFSASFSMNFSPKKRKQEGSSESDGNSPDRKEIEERYEDSGDLAHIINNPAMYVDFNIPWSVNGSYSLGYRKRGFEEPTITQSLRINGQFKLTDKTSVSYTSGYDFEAKDLTQTSFNLSRDLHCWVMTFNWVPFGRFQSYNFLIRAKSAILQDLKLERKRRYFDEF